MSVGDGVKHDGASSPFPLKPLVLYDLVCSVLRRIAYVHSGLPFVWLFISSLKSSRKLPLVDGQISSFDDSHDAVW